MTAASELPQNSNLLVSWVKDATDTATQDCDALSIVEAIRSDKWRELIEDIRNTYRTVLEETGDRKEAKKAVAAAKKKLRGVLWSGRFSQRANDALLSHSGLLCGDLDELGERLEEVQAKLLLSPHLWALFRSPTGDGLKAVFRVVAASDKHLASYLAVERHVQELCGVQIDQACKDVARLCFLSSDPAAYLNPDAIELPPMREAAKPATTTAIVVTGTPLIDARRRIATGLLGEINWQSDTLGRCDCPGKHRHTNGDAMRDCEVLIDGTPTIRCVHASCRPNVESMNATLRSSIAKMEFALPAIEDAVDFMDTVIETPPDIIDDLLHRGSKMVLGGGSKSFKTWQQVDLAVSVGTGAAWLGQQTHQGRVLYLNLELPAQFFWKRIQDVARARHIKLEPGQLKVWNLRGHAADLSRLLGTILEATGTDKFDLIVIDPIYKVLGNRDENRAGDIAGLLNEIERLAVQSGAAVVFGSHFSKGNQAGRESIDRISGSGVFARDPDTILIFTKHEEENAFTVEATLRNHPPITPFVVRWEFPLMIVDDLLDPSRLKQIGGREKVYHADQLLALLDKVPLKTTDWMKLAKSKLGMSRASFYRLLDKLDLEKDERGRWSKRA